MKEKSKKLLRTEICFAALGIALFLAVILNVWIGSANISVGDVFKILFTNQFAGQGAHTIVWSVRLPRLCAAALLGGALGVSGYLIQTYFRNPIWQPVRTRHLLGRKDGARFFYRRRH